MGERLEDRVSALGPGDNCDCTFPSQGNYSDWSTSGLGVFFLLFSLDYLLKCTTESRDPKLAMKIVGATFQQ